MAEFQWQSNAILVSFRILQYAIYIIDIQYYI